MRTRGTGLVMDSGAVPRVFGATALVSLLALASNLAIIVQAVHLQCCLTCKHPGLGFRHVLADVVKIVAASVVMGAVVAAGWWAWSRANMPGHW